MPEWRWPEDSSARDEQTPPDQDAALAEQAARHLSFDGAPQAEAQAQQNAELHRALNDISICSPVNAQHQQRPYEYPCEAHEQQQQLETEPNLTTMQRALQAQKRESSARTVDFASLRHRATHEDSVTQSDTATASEMTPVSKARMAKTCDAQVALAEH